jgi:hypothetical protein
MKYQVTDSRGQIHKRTSDRTYTHAVVHHVPAPRPEDKIVWASEAYSKARWCGRADLARKEAAGWQANGFEAEIIPVGE